MWGSDVQVASSDWVKKMDKHDKNLKSEHKVHLKGSGPF